MLSYPEAIKLLYKEYNCRVETESTNEEKNSLKRRILYLITKVANYYKENFKYSQEALNYTLLIGGLLRNNFKV
jgi:hypothetical protein